MATYMQHEAIFLFIGKKHPNKSVAMALVQALVFGTTLENSGSLKLSKG